MLQQLPPNYKPTHCPVGNLFDADNFLGLPSVGTIAYNNADDVDGQTAKDRLRKSAGETTEG